MPRKFKTANYTETLKLSITLGEALPASHLARFVVEVIAQLDLRAVYARHAPERLRRSRTHLGRHSARYDVSSNAFTPFSRLPEQHMVEIFRVVDGQIAVAVILPA